jgi:hypothetical protein
LPLASERATRRANAQGAGELQPGEPSESVVDVRRRRRNAELLERRAQADAEYGVGRGASTSMGSSAGSVRRVAGRIHEKIY